MSWLESARHSLRGRLALGLVAGPMTVMTVSFGALHVLIRDELYRHMDKDLAGRMTAIAMYAATHPARESVVEFMPQFRTRTHEDFFQVWDHAGRTLARSDSSVGRDLPLLDAVGGRPTYYDLTLPDGHVGRAVVQVVELPHRDTRGSLTVVTAEETEGLVQLEGRIHLMLIAVAAATTLALLAFTQVAVRRVIRRVDEFARSLERVDPDDPKPHLETGALSRTSGRPARMPRRARRRSATSVRLQPRWSRSWIP